MGVGDWLVDFRTGVNRIVSICLEFVVAGCLSQESVPLHRLQVHELRNVGSRRGRRGVLEKMQILRKLATHGESANAILKVISECNDMHSTIRNVGN